MPTLADQNPTMQFLSMAAHELKNPIATLKLLSQTHIARYKKYGSDKLSLEELELIEEELNRLTRLVDDVLDDTRIENGKLNLSLGIVDLNTLLTNTISKMKVTCPNHNLIIKKSPPLLVVADPQRIEQVLVNLITNATRYSNPGSDIEIKAQKDKTYARVLVKDYGIGMTQEKLHSIFDRLYQVDDKSSVGFGLGLYISKEIVKAHKGMIWVESELGKGSTFYFSLCLYK